MSSLLKLPRWLRRLYTALSQRLTSAGWALLTIGLVASLQGSISLDIPTYHIGSFADSMHRLVKSLFLGGVTRRFPRLNIAVLECGVGWAAILLAERASLH